MNAVNNVEDAVDKCNQLYAIHLSLGNYVEAAYTYLKLADYFDWRNRILPPLGKWPTETLITRKARIYLKAIKTFSDGKHWEKGIQLAKELRQRCEEIQHWELMSEITVNLKHHNNYLEYRSATLGKYHKERQIL